MLLVNGYIRILTESGGFDAKGNPVVRTEELGEKIPCNWVRNSYQGKGTYEGGVFTSAAYTILIDRQEFSPCRFNLYDAQDVVLGTYEVQQKGIVELFAVGNIQLTV